MSTIYIIHHDIILPKSDLVKVEDFKSMFLKKFLSYFVRFNFSNYSN